MSQPSTLKFHGHACFEISDGQNSILIDPFLAPANPKAVARPEELKPSIIALTHGHFDHVHDAEAIAKANKSTIVAVVEIANWYADKGIQTVDINIGGSAKFDWGFIKLVPALHTNTLPDGTAIGQAAGLIINFNGTTIYHSGDTGIFSDMKLLSELDPVDVAIVPAGDHYTMGPSVAAKAIGLIKPKIAIPCHYNTFPKISIDIDEFAKPAAKNAGEVKILQPGESINL